MEEEILCIYPKFMENFPKNFRMYLSNSKNLGSPAASLDRWTQNVKTSSNWVSLWGSTPGGGVMSSTRKALESGASREEIVHAVMLGMTTSGFPNTIAALGWVEEVISQK
jgi:4-carboxymuconolactone decarboxylase